MLSHNEILQRTAEVLLDEPIDIPVNITPQNKYQQLRQWLRIDPKQIVFKVRGTNARNMERISLLLLEMKIEPIPREGVTEWGYRLVINENYRLADIIATAIHNKKSKRPESLVNLILDNMPSAQLKWWSHVLEDRLNVADFISSIASVRTMNLLGEASPERPEIIAEPKVTSSEPLEELKNIFAGAQIT